MLVRPGFYVALSGLHFQLESIYRESTNIVVYGLIEYSHPSAILNPLGHLLTIGYIYDHYTVLYSSSSPA